MKARSAPVINTNITRLSIQDVDAKRLSQASSFNTRASASVGCALLSHIVCKLAAGVQQLHAWQGAASLY
jgi:hypothetical protein